MKKAKAQQEAVGFIVIILIVVIAGVIFLGISLRKPIEKINDPEINNFLSSSSRYTSSCAKTYEPNYLDLGELSYECFNMNSVCLDNKKACDVLNSTYFEMVSKFKPAGTLRYYSLSFGYKQEINETGREFLRIESGNSSKCRTRLAGRSLENLGSRGYIATELEICSA